MQFPSWAVIIKNCFCTILRHTRSVRKIMAEEIKTPETEESEQKLYYQFHRRGHRRGWSVPGNDRPHPFPAGAQRLSAHRTLQGADHRLRHRRAVRRPVQPAHGRHQPHQGGRASLWTPSSRTSTGWASTGATGSSTARDYFEKDYESGGGAHQEGPGLCLRADAGGVQGHTAATSASPPCPPTGTGPSRRAWTCSSGCEHGEFPEGKP